MSKEIKMSDLFALPVIGAAVHVNIFQLKGHHNDGKSPFDAIDTAINNHDRLVEENKNLKDELESLEDDYKNEFNTSEDLRCEKEDLVEENKRLREFCKSLQLDVSNEIKLEQLLSELGGE